MTALRGTGKQIYDTQETSPGAPTSSATACRSHGRRDAGARGRERIQSDHFVGLRSHFGFDAFFREPGSPGAHEKDGVEGETYGDDGDDLTLVLSRRIVSGEEDSDSVESVFAQAPRVAAVAEALLVDDEWRAPEPVAAEAVTVGAGADERLDEVSEPQRTCSPGRSSWRRSRSGPRTVPAGLPVHPSPYSSGRWSRSRERRSPRQLDQVVEDGRVEEPALRADPRQEQRK